MVLCIRLGYRVPGTNTIPAQISADKTPYYKALEAADAAWRERNVDLSILENYLSHLLAQQLASVVDDAIRARE